MMLRWISVRRRLDSGHQVYLPWAAPVRRLACDENWGGNSRAFAPGKKFWWHITGPAASPVLLFCAGGKCGESSLLNCRLGLFREFGFAWVAFGAVSGGRPGLSRERRYQGRDRTTLFGFLLVLIVLRDLALRR